MGDILEPANAKPTDEMVAEAGYPMETHTVATGDGYLLMVHRIPGGREGVVEREEREEEEGREGWKDRPAVFLQHGLMASSADWVSAGGTVRESGEVTCSGGGWTGPRPGVPPGGQGVRRLDGQLQGSVGGGKEQGVIVSSNQNQIKIVYLHLQQ